MHSNFAGWARSDIPEGEKQTERKKLDLYFKKLIKLGKVYLDDFLIVLYYKRILSITTRIFITYNISNPNLVTRTRNGMSWTRNLLAQTHFECLRPVFYVSGPKWKISDSKPFNMDKFRITRTRFLTDSDPNRKLGFPVFNILKVHYFVFVIFGEDCIGLERKKKK